MLRFAALLLALVCGASAFTTDLSGAIAAYHEAQGEAGVGAAYYFPCREGVTAQTMVDLDLQRLSGVWFSVNTAFAVSYKYDTDRIQKGISQSLGCSVVYLNNTNQRKPVVDQFLSLRQALPANATVPGGWKVVDDGNGLFRATNASLPRAGNNGKWLLRQSLGNATLYSDAFFVATDYTNFALWYTCSDVPVPGTIDTKREQQWGLQRRYPRNYSNMELFALKLLAAKKGIIDLDHVFTVPTDGC